MDAKEQLSMCVWRESLAVNICIYLHLTGRPSTSFALSQLEYLLFICQVRVCTYSQRYIHIFGVITGGNRCFYNHLKIVLWDTFAEIYLGVFR